MLLWCPTHLNNFTPLSAVSICLFIDHSFINILFHQPERHLPYRVRGVYKARTGQTKDGKVCFPRIKVHLLQMFSYPTKAKSNY